jgi:hypothetical protein
MIAEQKDTTGLVLNSPLRSQRLGVRNFGKMASILQDTLYTDKELAPLREYSTNASDAHVEAGCPDRPIIVRLPNRFNPVLAIRDFGPGMDEHRVWNVFCNYGESTKDASNDEAGMFGIGSKSAFAYGKSFTIVSFLNGIRKSYVCHTGGCNEGEFVELGSEPTTEENGLEIQIPIQSVDIDTFVNKAAKFFTHWRVTPIFEGNNIELPKIEKEFEGRGWYLPTKFDRHSTQKPKFLMGNIPYDLPEISKLKPDLFGIDSDESHNISRMLNLGLVLSSPIGDVDVAANRESLQLTDKTLAKIWEILKRVRSELSVIMDKAFDVLPTNYEKKQLRAKYNSYDHSYHTLSFLLSPKYASLGCEYSLGENVVARGFKVEFYARGRRGSRRVRMQNNHFYSISCDEKFLCVTAGEGDFTPIQVRNRVVNLIEKTTNPFGKSFQGIMVILVTDRIKFADWCGRMGFDLPMTELSSLKEYKMSDIYPSLKKPSVRSINSDKNCSKFLALDMTSTYGSNSDYFKPVSVPKKPTTKLPYITIERYEVCDFGDNSSPKNAIKFIKEIADRLGFSVPTQIVAVKKSVSDKLNSNYFIPLAEYFVNQVINKEKFFSDMVTLKLRCNTNLFTTSCMVYKSKSVDLQLVNTMSKLAVKFVDGNSLIGNTLELLNKLKVTVNTSKPMNDDSVIYEFLRKCRGVDCVKIEETIDQLLLPLVNNISEIADRYPMISLVDDYVLRYLNSSSNSTASVKIIDYINFVDSTVNKK